MIVRNTRKGKNMNQNAITKIGRISLLFLLVVPVLVTTQKGWAQVSGKHHAHYKVIDTGSFGGPSSHLTLGAHILNNNGTFTGYADTTEPDPYAPDECWDGNCLVAHAFRWSHGKLTELGVVDSGPHEPSRPARWNR
jgi:hypothetical protein